MDSDKQLLDQSSPELVPKENSLHTESSPHFSSDVSTSLDNEHIRRHHTLRPVKANPKLQFPTEHIYIIEQCLNPPKFQSPCDNTEPHGHKFWAQSSDISGDGDNYCADLCSNEQPPSLAELIPLPVTLEESNQLGFDEKLIISVQSNADATTDIANPPNEMGNLHGLLDTDCLLELGAFFLNVESFENRFHINNTNQFTFEEQVAVNSIEANYTNMLTLIQEKRLETLFSENHKCEQSIQIRLNEAKNIYELSSKVFDVRLTKRKGFFDASKVQNFIMDGGSFLLMRLLVQRQFIGQLVTQTIGITGQFYKSTYCCSRKNNIMVNNRLCVVTKIRRVLQLEGNLAEVSISVFLESGHLIRHTWQDCPYIIHIDPNQNVDELLATAMSCNATNKRLLDEPLLRMQYIDFRNDRLVDLRSYTRESPKVVSVIRDYVYCLLHAQPTNVLDYTIKHFTDNIVSNENSTF